MLNIQLSKEEKETFEYLGILKFWAAGYTGNNVRIMSGEKIQEQYEKTDRWKKVICPDGYQGINGSSHGSSVMYILLQVCPDAEYYAYPFNCSGTVTTAKSACAEYIKEKGIHLFTTSNLASSENQAKKKLMQECIDIVGTTFFAAAGNKATKGLCGESKLDTYLAIGGVIKNNGKWERVSYSSIGEELDYVSIATYGTGTSYIAPIFCGMCGLVQDFFIDKAGRALYRHELISFINDNLIDVGIKGFDIHTGNGLFVLPNPKDIDIKKYCSEYKEQDNNNDKNNIPIIPEKEEEQMEDMNTENKTKIEMFIDKKYMYVNGERVEIDTAPFIKNGRTFVPIRFVSEYLGRTIDWNDKEQKVTIE